MSLALLLSVAGMGTAQADDLEERKWGLSLSALLEKPAVLTKLK